MDGIRLARMPLIAILLLLPSCQIPGLRGPDSAQNLPETFNGTTSETSSAQVEIGEFFSDPILTGLIDQGMAGNQELKILGEEIEIANAEILKRRGAYLPFITVGGSPRLDKYGYYTIPGSDNLYSPYPSGGHFPSPLPDFLMSANLSWQIDIWRQLRNARDAASLRYLGTIDGRNYVVTRLVAEIAENYYNLMALDKRMENLDRTIHLQEQSLQVAIAKKEAARGTELAVQRFQAEVRRNQSDKLIISQDIIEAENKINFLVGRYPQTVERSSADFYNLNLNPLQFGVPSDLLLNRPDVRKAERDLEAAGLDIEVARANFYPKLSISAGVGYEAFNTKYLFQTPESLIYNVAGNIVSPLINKSAIKAEYMTANARQLQALYHYQRTLLNAFTEVVNRMTMVQNYTASLEIKKQQLEALEASVEAASRLFQAARVEYVDVLFAQRDLRDARMVYIDTKKQQLSAIVNTYQALGGGLIQFNYPGVGETVPIGPSMPLPPFQGDPNAPVDPNAPPPVPADPNAAADPNGVEVPAAPEKPAE